MSENSVSNSKPSRNNGEGGRDFIVFTIHFKAWLHTKGIGAVLDTNYDSQPLRPKRDCSTLIIAAGESGSTASAAKEK